MDSNRLCRLGLGDSRVFRRMDVKKSPHTAVHILLDRSPSMSAIVASQDSSVGRRIDLALEATLSLAMALEGIQGVSVGITAFPGKDGEGTSVYRLLPHGSTIRNRVAAFGTELDGSTPLAEAIWYAGAQLLQQQEDKKILFVLTDGIPDDLETAQDVLEKCHHARIEVTGIGLGIEVDRVFESSVCVMQMGDLSRRLHEICKNQMIV